jgi:chaperonin GroES
MTQTLDSTPTLATSNTYDLGTLKFWALGDRVLIEEDEFKTGYECSTCNGTGKAPCGDCGGSGTHLRGAVTIKCSHCDSGAVTCPECKGKGGLIIAPDVAQRRPTTGRVVSVGPGTKDHEMLLRVGDSVMYSNFAGYVVDLNRAGRKVILRILHESEILCRLEGQLDLKSLRGQSEITNYSA